MAIQNTAFNYANSVLTTNSTPTDIFAHGVYEGESGFFNYRIVCQRLSDGATKSWTVTGALKRLQGQAPVTYSELLGSIMGSTGDKLALLSVNAGFTYDGANIILRVTGLSNTDIIWWAEMDGHVVYDDSN